MIPLFGYHTYEAKCGGDVLVRGKRQGPEENMDIDFGVTVGYMFKGILCGTMMKR